MAARPSTTATPHRNHRCHNGERTGAAAELGQRRASKSALLDKTCPIRGEEGMPGREGSPLFSKRLSSRKMFFLFPFVWKTRFPRMKRYPFPPSGDILVVVSLVTTTLDRGSVRTGSVPSQSRREKPDKAEHRAGAQYEPCAPRIAISDCTGG